MQIETSTPPRGLSLDAKVFLATALAGFGLMVVLKLAEFPQIGVTIAIAGLVVGYSFLVVRLGRLHLRLDQAGDNAYYLGLVFTLLSMGWALWEIGQRLAASETETVSVAETVIGDFGLALGSTLAGIVCRIVLHQMRVDPADIESESRIQLSQATARMVSQLNDMTSKFGDFTTTLLHKQQDYATEMAAQHKQMRDELEGQVKRAASESVSALTEVSQRVSESIAVFAAATADSCQAFSDAADRLRAVEPPPARLSKRFDDMAGKVESITVALGGASTLLATTVESMRTAADTMSMAATASSEWVPEMRSQLNDHQHQHANSLEMINQATNSMRVSIGQLEVEAARLGAEAGKSAEAVASAEDKAVDVLERLTAVVRKLDGSVTQRDVVG